MSKTITLSGLDGEIRHILTEFEDVEHEKIKKAIRASGNKLKRDITAASPVRTGGYTAGWSSKMDGDSLSGYYVTVYNADKPGLAHLLEKGHANRGGGRTPAYPHIAPAYQEAAADLKRRLS